ncbi:MAG: family 1 glycosylhydrolase, partial [Clostridia bacterium]|nr:family 1 glycosylhydrolase [Clostridia bacterium]
INEPNVYVGNGYFFGSWPPGKKSLRLMVKVYKNMTLCHIAAYKAIHEVRRKMKFPGKTMVGVANHVCIFVPYDRRSPLDRIAAAVARLVLQDSVVAMMTRGEVPLPLRPFIHMKRGDYYDFIGVNYYQRRAMHFRGFKDDVLPGVPKNDLGWEIYPEGLEMLCRKYYRRYRVPIWITENGTCDNTDSFRARYIADHLAAVKRAADGGAKVERYYHWSIIDNFEWAEGESARFGLIYCDYETQRRTVKKSGRIYGEICEAGGVTEEIAVEIENA